MSPKERAEYLAHGLSAPVDTKVWIFRRIADSHVENPAISQFGMKLWGKLWMRVRVATTSLRDTKYFGWYSS